MSSAVSYSCPRDFLSSVKFSLQEVLVMCKILVKRFSKFVFMLCLFICWSCVNELGHATDSNMRWHPHKMWNMILFLQVIYVHSNILCNICITFIVSPQSLKSKNNIKSLPCLYSITCYSVAKCISVNSIFVAHLSWTLMQCWCRKYLFWFYHELWFKPAGTIHNHSLQFQDALDDCKDVLCQ